MLKLILGNVVTQVSSSGAWAMGVLSSPGGAVPGEMTIFSHLSKGYGTCSCQAEAQDGSGTQYTDAVGARGENSAWDLHNLTGCGNSQGIPVGRLLISKRYPLLVSITGQI